MLCFYTLRITSYTSLKDQFHIHCLQIQNLLDAMHLAQYKDVFASEQITGEVLAELDEEILQKELGVSVKIHRVRLMKVINGKYSVQQILSGIDPYVSFSSP